MGRSVNTPVQRSWRELWLPVCLTAILAVLPAESLQLAGWSDHLEIVPLIALLGVAAGCVLGRSHFGRITVHIAAGLGGLILVSLLYAWFMPVEAIGERVIAFLNRVVDWLGVAFGGAPGTDNLLFAYTMGLLGWVLGYAAAWSVVRLINPWWAIVTTSVALLLNLSYAPPELLPLVFIQLLVSFMLLITVSSMGRTIRWRLEDVEQGSLQTSRYAMTSIAMAALIVVIAWHIPTGQVSQGVATVWETVSGPWQTVQANFDRVFASLNPSPLSGRGLLAVQTMAPRGSFELGSNPVMVVTGSEPAYWRAATYDDYTGHVMTSSNPTATHLDRRQPLMGGIETDQAREIVEYSTTLLAPSSSVLFAPDSPLTISVPAEYDYRGDVHDYGLLKPLVPIQQNQKYSVLTAVSRASVEELRQASGAYPAWTRPYLQVPTALPRRVREEAQQIVGDATNAYDAASNVESYLRTFTYSTHVSVPPADRDWVAYLLFSSKEGYCDYFATAMTVMLRSVGIPARVASGYVTGTYDPSTRSYLVTEADAHSWTEVYFPEYGWITFEPSANRPTPARLEKPLTPLSTEELQQVLEADQSQQDFLDDSDLFDDATYVAPLPVGTSGGLPPLVSAAILGLALLAFAVLLAALLWVRGISRLPAFARAYAQVVRLAAWSGLGPRRGETPYEFARELVLTVPALERPLETVTSVYVGGIYGGYEPDTAGLRRLRSAGREVIYILLHSIALRRWSRWLVRRLHNVAHSERR